MKPIPLKISVKSSRNRWFSYLILGVIMGTVGLLIALDAYKDYKAGGGGDSTFRLIIGIALPFIFVIGEMIRFKRYCRKIAAVFCIDCRFEFDIDELCKTGKCPECRSKRVVGLIPDDEDTILTLY